MRTKKNYQFPQTTVTDFIASHVLMVSGGGGSSQAPAGNVNNTSGDYIIGG